jgi:hypothetical protein
MGLIISLLDYFEPNHALFSFRRCHDSNCSRFVGTKFWRDPETTSEISSDAFFQTLPEHESQHEA